MMNVQTMLIENIRRDGGTQPRAALNMDAVHDYAKALKDDAKFPPVRVFFDGTDHWLSNGFHRIAAHELAGWKEIEAEVMQGTQRDAKWDSFSANKDQGLRRHKEDMRRILFCIFSDSTWKSFSQRDIASHTGIAKTVVGEMLLAYRKETGKDGPRAGPAPHNKGAFKTDAVALTPSAPAQQPRADEDDRSDMHDEGSSPTEAAGTDDANDTHSAKADGPPFAAFNAGVEEVKELLRQAYARFSKLTEYSGEKGGRQFKSRWAQGYSPMGTLGVMTALAKSLDNGMPAELWDRPPGFRTNAQVKGSVGFQAKGR